MSFSGQIKEEIERCTSQARHCQLAELSALYRFCGRKEGNGQLVFSSENELAIRKCFTLLKKTFNIYNDISWDDVANMSHKTVYKVTVDDVTIANKVVSALLAGTVTQNSCCRRSYIRGAFLAVGSISDPEKSYHLEFVSQDEADAVYLGKLLATFDVEAKVIERKKYYVLYVKDGTQIVDVLNIIGAHKAMMDFENTRILKEVRNSVNRKINCELANIGKTISAAQKQIEDIRMLMSSPRYKSVPDNLKYMAELRIQYPEASLKELGELADPPVGKSGVNHRLRKLSELAEAIKEENYDKEGSNHSS